MLVVFIYSDFLGFCRVFFLLIWWFGNYFNHFEKGLFGNTKFGRIRIIFFVVYFRTTLADQQSIIFLKMLISRVLGTKSMF